MKDETLAIVIVAVVIYYMWFAKKRAASTQVRSAAWSGNTVNTSGSSAGRNRYAKGLPSTPNQGNGKGFRYAPIANVGKLNTAPAGASSPGSPTALGSQPGKRSSGWSGWGASFVAPQWPTKRVTSTGTQTIGNAVVQVPSYTAVPLTPVGPGGGGAIIYSGGAQ